jgi:hypothetical protein
VLCKNYPLVRCTKKTSYIYNMSGALFLAKILQTLNTIKPFIRLLLQKLKSCPPFSFSTPISPKTEIVSSEKLKDLETIARFAQLAYCTLPHIKTSLDAYNAKLVTVFTERSSGMQVYVSNCLIFPCPHFSMPNQQNY